MLRVSFRLRRSAQAPSVGSARWFTDQKEPSDGSRCWTPPRRRDGSSQGAIRWLTCYYCKARQKSLYSLVYLTHAVTRCVHLKLRPHQTSDQKSYISSRDTEVFIHRSWKLIKKKKKTRCNDRKFVMYFTLMPQHALHKDATCSQCVLSGCWHKSLLCNGPYNTEEPQMETAHSSSPLSSLPGCTENHLTPTSIMYFKIITGKKR